MSRKISYECDVCKKQFKDSVLIDTLENDIFGLESGSDICVDCNANISKFIKEYIENKEWGG